MSAMNDGDVVRHVEFINFFPEKKARGFLTIERSAIVI